MRILLVVALLGSAGASSAQTVLKREPLSLNPGEVVYVDDGACTAGKILKITGAMRGLHRKKICIDGQQREAALGAVAE